MVATPFSKIDLGAVIHMFEQQMFLGFVLG